MKDTRGTQDDDDILSSVINRYVFTRNQLKRNEMRYYIKFYVNTLSWLMKFNQIYYKRVN